MEVVDFPDEQGRRDSVDQSSNGNAHYRSGQEKRQVHGNFCDWRGQDHRPCSSR
jgi:hypothetical protein